jgi:hypothetical protein
MAIPAERSSLRGIAGNHFQCGSQCLHNDGLGLRQGPSGAADLVRAPDLHASATAPPPPCPPAPRNPQDRTGRSRWARCVGAWCYAASPASFRSRPPMSMSAMATAPLSIEHHGQQFAVRVDAPIADGVAIGLPVFPDLDHAAHPSLLARAFRSRTLMPYLAAVLAESP